MSMDQVLETIRTFDGILELAPTEGGPFPEIAWGDHFFYYAPDGQVPRHQPYATVVTKNYPDDTSCDLDRPGRWRLNIHVGRTAFTELVGTEPKQVSIADVDFTAVATVLPHPLYHAQGWVAIVNPDEQIHPLAISLLRDAHDAARRRAARRES